MLYSNKNVCVHQLLMQYLNTELIFVNPVVKCSVATWQMTDLCLNVHKPGRLSECI